MSVPYSQVPSTLLLDPDMTLTAVRVWHVIYVETLGRPGWDLSYGQIAEKIGSSRRQTAMEAVRLLLDKGWLVRTQRKDAAGDDAPNLFAVCREPFVPWNTAEGVRPSAQGGTPERTTPEVEGVRQSAQGGTPQRTTGGAPQRTHQKNHLPEESPASTVASRGSARPLSLVKNELLHDRGFIEFVNRQRTEPIRSFTRFPWKDGELEAYAKDYQQRSQNQAVADTATRIFPDDSALAAAVFNVLSSTTLLQPADMTDEATLTRALSTDDALHDLAHLATSSANIRALASRLDITLPAAEGEPRTFEWANSPIGDISQPNTYPVPRRVHA